VMALALPADGKVITCDVSETFTAIARKAWKDAGVEGKIELRIGPAVQTLPTLAPGSFDLAFLDADKSSYDVYYEASLRLVRPGGLILIDNVLWSGRVVDPQVDDADTNAIRKLNAKIQADVRVSLSVVPIGDGLTIVRPRPGRV
jgi:predicted O-methyltransferase YrrM